MIFITKVNAIDPKTGELREGLGPRIESISWNEAQKILDERGLWFCKIYMILHAENGDNTEFQKLYN